MGTVDRAAVIVEEQHAVDHAYDCVDLDQRVIDRIKKDFRSDCADAGLSPVSDAPPEFGRREDLDGLALVTMRVDLTEDPDDKLTWYLGRRTVRDGEGELVVVKWTNREPTKWRLATPAKPGDVRLLRSLRCDRRKVLDYSERSTRSSAKGPARIRNYGTPPCGCWKSTRPAANAPTISS